MKTETIIFDPIVPHPAPVQVSDLLNDIEGVIQRHVILNEHAAAALAVWVLHTYVFEMRDTVAYVAIESPEKRCGKTTLLSVLAAMACKPLIASNITVGALFRSVHTCSPTLFIDEADTFMAGNGTMRGIINSGNTRRTAYVLRLSHAKQHHSAKEPSPHPDPIPSHPMGAEREQQANAYLLNHSNTIRQSPVEYTNTGLKKYSCWCPKVIAMIGQVPDTIADRSIVVKMARKLTTETCAPLSELQTDDIKAKCMRFGLDMAQHIAEAGKIRGGGLNDRAADTFDPLFVIARLAGDEWEHKLHKAALALSSTAEIENSGAGLILDVLSLFGERGIDKMFSRDIVALLREGSTESPGLKYSAIDEYQISKILRPYGVKPVSIRMGREVRNGYHSADFRDAVTRYVSEADREAHLKKLERRWNLQAEAKKEIARQEAQFEKAMQMVPPGQKMTEPMLKELLQKIENGEQSAEPMELPMKE
jgi:hypothetical protein